MSDSALNRTARALDLIPYVMENSGISIEQLAKDFNIAPKEILKDLNLLFVCGLPGYTPLELIDLSFETGFVSVIDPQSLDRPRKLSRRELIALILSLDGLSLSRPVGDQLGFEIELLRQKISAVMADGDIAFASNQGSSQRSPFLETIEMALVKHLLLEFIYLSANKDEKRTRLVQPSYLYFENGQIYLHGHCFESQGERTFRLDRITAARVLTQSESNLLSLGRSEPAPPLDFADSPIILEITATARNFLEENATILRVQTTNATGTTAEISITDPEWLIRTCLGYGDAVRILAPEALRLILEERTQETLASYK
jgi:proteasome accessory factor C